MSNPDYDQFSEDHQCFLIVIKPIGPQMNQNLFNLIYENLMQLNELTITNNKIVGFERIIRIRFKQSYSIEENDWGDFQTHRKLVGLITIARSFHRNEIESISELHKTIHDTYNNTLLDSKCFIIKSLNTNEQQINSEKIESIPGTDDNDISYHNDDNLNNDNEEEKFNFISNDNDTSLLDFNMGGQLYISSDHNCFTSRVNRFSSSSSLSSQNSPSPTSSQPLATISNESSNYSLPPLTNDGINFNRTRTHSRNKSLDSKLLQIDQSNTSTIKQNELAPNGQRLQGFSSSSSLLTSNDCDSVIYSAANVYVDYETDEQCCEHIKAKIKEFLIGIFWALESKRLDKTREKKEKIPLLMAPCEKKDLVGLDTDTRSFKKKCLGRMQKHIADLSLMVGLAQDSFLNYLQAIENLKSVNDKLWLAAAYEGLCASSLILLFPQRWQHIHNLRHRFSYSKGMIHDLLVRRDYETAQTEVGQTMKQIAIEYTQFDQQITTNKVINKYMPTIEHFYEKYKDAACNYSLYRGAAVLEFECCVKAVKTLTFFRRYLKASFFIQNALCISLNQQMDEQIERLLRISNLYEMIGFYRKAAFFKRFAAMKTVSQPKNLDWNKCYFLLLSSLCGYGLTLDPNEYDKRLESGNVNWSTIHVQLLQEIITTSLKMQNETLAIRHISFMLQCLFAHITSSQRQEFATKLSTLSSKCGEGSPVTLRLSNGSTIPSVNFTKFPTVVYFKIEPLKSYLKLFKLKHKSFKDDDDSDSKYSGPFIYTPLQLNRSPQKINNYKNPNSVTKMNFYWGEGNMCSVSLSLHNYLPIELNISSIILMTDGVAFEPKHDTSLKISPYSTYTNISLTGIPRSSGTLDILGYKIHTLGIKSDCRLKQLPNSKKLKLPSKFTVEVVPRLPLMCAQCLADDLEEDFFTSRNISSHKDYFSDYYINNSNYISVFEGQRKTYKIKLSNISTNSDEFIDLVNMKIIYPKQIKSYLKELVNIEWNVNAIKDLLPFGPGMSIEFDITMSVMGDFILSKSSKHEKKLSLTSNESQQKKAQVLGSKKLANFIHELQSRKSSNDFSSMLNNSNNQHQQIYNKTFDTNDDDQLEEIPQSKIIELCLEFEYSGGPGLNSGFCRRTNIYFVIEVKSSILITHWDVIQAEDVNECYLVFDTLNATEQEINLIYSPNKEMLIESKEKCRIPVPIKRCPLRLGIMDEQMEEIESNGSCANNNYKIVPTSGGDGDSGNKKSIKCTKSVDFLTNIFPTKQKLEAILYKCRLHLLKQIDLRWTMPNTDLDGSVFVEKVPYSNELLKSLLIPPIQSEIELNSMLFRSSYGEFNVKLGEYLSISIRLFNNSDTTLNYLRLYMVYYQDYQNASLTRTRNYDINTRIVINGCESFCLNELQTKETYVHQCGMMFLYTGVYKLEICCLPEERYQQMTVDKGASLIDVHQNTQHSLFKCLHTFEITVDE